MVTAFPSGASVSNLTVQAGVSLIVSSGGTASRTRLQFANETVADGGQILGTTTFVTSSTLVLGAISGISLTVSGFDSTDKIDLTAFEFGGSEELSVVSSGTVQLTITDGTQTAKVSLFGQYAAAGFHLSQEGGGTALTYTPPANLTNGTATWRRSARDESR